MKKKYVVTLMILCMVISTVACGSRDVSKKEESFSQVISMENNDYSENKEESNTSDADENKNENDTNIIENNEAKVSEVQDNSNKTNVDEEYANLPESQGFVFESNGDGTCILAEIGDCMDTDIVIPEKSPAGDVVTMIAEYAFYSAEDINSIVIIGKTIELDKYSFQSCEVEKIVISGCNINIGENAFSYCDDVTEVYISNSAIEINAYAFYDSGKDMDVKIVNCTGTLEEDSFQSSQVLGVTISSSDLRLDENVFPYCDDITNVVFENSTLEVGAYAFYDSGDDMVVTGTDCNLNLGEDSFQSSHLVNLVLNNCETILDKNAFSYCGDLTEVSIDGKSIEIGEYAFYDCTDLINVSLAADSEDDLIMITLDDNAFQSCGVQNVIVGRGQVELGENAFSYCDNLTKVEFKGSSLDVGEYAFYGCPAELSIAYNGVSYNKESIENVK